MYYINKDMEHRFITDVFVHMGLGKEDASLGADVLTQSDLSGVFSHGLSRLPTYIKRITSENINLKADLKIRNITESLIAIDGDNGLGVVVGPKAQEICIERAKEHGISAVVVNNSYHYGVGNYYGWKYAEAGLIGISITNTTHHVAPFGGVEPLMGTNPITIAIPSGKNYPIVLDMATCVAAFSKIFVASKANEKIPFGWGIDKEGKPTDDPVKALEGALLPISEHKGYGLAVIIEVLTSVLGMAAYGHNPKEEYKVDNSSFKKIGHFKIAIDVSKFIDLDYFKKSVDTYIDTIKNSKKSDGFEEIYMPGEIEFLNAEKIEKTGIPIPSELQELLLNMSNEIGFSNNSKNVKELFEKYR